MVLNLRTEGTIEHHGRSSKTSLARAFGYSNQVDTRSGGMAFQIDRETLPNGARSSTRYDYRSSVGAFQSAAESSYAYGLSV